MQAIHRKVRADEAVTDAEWAAWKEWRGIGSSSSGGQKRKRKRKKRKLPRNSSCPRLAARHLGRYRPEGYLCRGTFTAFVARAVRTWKPGLSTSHWYLAPCSVPVTPEEHRKIWSFLGVHYAELFLRPLVSGSHLCGVFHVPLSKSFWIFLEDDFWYFRLKHSLVRQWIHAWRQSPKAWSRTADYCGFSAVAVHHWSSTSLLIRRGSSSWSRLFSRPQRFPSRSSLVVDVLVVRSCRFSCCLFEDSRDPTVLLVVITVVVQRQIPWSRLFV